jgi:hypothetical protein
MKKLFSFLTAGQLPYSVAILLCIAAWLMGQQQVKPGSRIAVAEKGAIILEAALNHPGATDAQLKAQITEPVTRVLRHYQDLGYVVIDSSKNAQGDMTVAELPPNALDITNEMRAAVQLPAQGAAAPQTASAPGPASHVD